jgi:spore coat protein H
MFWPRLSSSCLFLAYSAVLAVANGSTANAAWPGQELFTNQAVHSLRIEIAPPDLEKLKKDPREFVRAEIVEGTNLYHDVAVHLKGSVGSFRPIDDKPGFTLDFDRFQTAHRFHGLRRIHLNNSVEDPSYCNEALGSELFRMASIPAPRVARAVVTLNQRRLGLYVLKEGFTEDFLSCYFKTISGNLFEPDEGHDVNQHLKRASVQAPDQDRKTLKALADASLEPLAELRWKQLQNVLDLDQFIRFMAIEVMICHRDGYCLARNNFRVYQNLDNGKMVFFPHGMDQLFGTASLPWTPHMAGLVAKAVLDTSEGKQRYSDEFRSLFDALFKPELLSHRVDQLVEPLRSALNASEFEAVKAQSLLVKERIVDRRRQLESQLSGSALPPMQFTNGTALLTAWTSTDSPSSGKMDQVDGPDGLACLHVVTSLEASSAWRARARLNAGHYRFQAKVRVSAVKPLAFGTHQGAGLRIAGQPRQGEDLTGNSDWRLLSHSFEVLPPGADVEFICEFRASSGEAWFDSSTLRVVRVP